MSRNPSEIATPSPAARGSAPRRPSEQQQRQHSSEDIFDDRQAPRSIPDDDLRLQQRTLSPRNEDERELDSKIERPRGLDDYSNSGEGEMVPAAGRVNAKGEVIGDEGTPIGKVINSYLGAQGGESELGQETFNKMSGYVVTQEGEILNHEGDVVGKAEPLENVPSELNYTTHNLQDNAEAAGEDAPNVPEGEDVKSAAGARSPGGGLGSVFGGIGRTLGGLTGGLGRSTAGVTGAVGDTAKGVTDTVGKKTGLEGVTDPVGNTVKGATDTAGNVTEGVTDTVGKTAEGATGAVGDATDGVTDTAGGAVGDVAGAAGDITQGATDAVGNTAEGVTDTVDDTVQGVTDTAGDATQGVTDQVGDATQGVTDTAGDATQGTADQPGDVTKGVIDTVGDTAGDVAGAAGDVTPGGTDAVGDTAEGVTNQAGDAVNGVTDTAGDNSERVTEQVDEAVPDVPGATGDASRDAPGEVDDAAQKGGQFIDADECLDDTEKPIALENKDSLVDDVTGKANDVAKDAQDAVQVPQFTPSVAGKVLQLFQGPFKVANNGQVADANHQILGKLVEGEDLTDKDIKRIDEEGNLYGDHEIVLGKIDLAPEGDVINRIKEEVPEAAPRLDALKELEQPVDVEDFAQSAPAKIPEFSPSIVGKILQMFEGPFTVAGNGQVTDVNQFVLGKLGKDQDIQDLIGKEIKGVDENGQLLGENDIVLGKVDLAPEGTVVDRIRDEVPEAAEKLDAVEDLERPTSIKVPQFSPSVAGKVLEMFEGPFQVADDGQVTDANNRTLGKLAEGQDYQDLVGKEIQGIDEDGQLLGENDTVLGKIDLVPEGTVADRIREEIPEAVEKLDAVEDLNRPTSIKVPEFTPSIAGKVLKLFEGPFQVADNGQVTDANDRILGKLAEGQDFQDLVGKEIQGIDENGQLLGDKGTVLGKIDLVPEGTVVDRIREEVPEAAERLDAVEDLERPTSIQVPEFTPSVAGKVLEMFEGPFKVADNGQVTDANDRILGRLVEGQDYQDLIGKEIQGIDENGQLLGDNGTVLGKVDFMPEGTVVDRIREEIPEAAERLDAIEELERPTSIQVPEFTPSVAGKVLKMFEGPFKVADNGQVTDANDRILGRLAIGQDFQDLIGKEIHGIDENGQLLGDNGTILGKVDLVPEGTILDRIREEIPEAADRLDALEQKAEEKAEEDAGPQLPHISTLEGFIINKMGNVVNEKGEPVGRVKSGDLSKMIGKQPDAEGRVWDSRGNILGEVEVLPEAIANTPSPFDDFPDAVIDKDGKVMFEGRQIGIVLGEGPFDHVVGKTVDPDGDILDKYGNVVGKAIRQDPEEPEEEPEEAIDYSMLRDKKVNKMGNCVDENGKVWGRVVSGILAHLIGKKVGDEGKIYNDAGKPIGQAEPIPADEMEDVKEAQPFEDFPGAIVGEKGAVFFQGTQVGIVVEGDQKKLLGKTVDPDGDILDKAGNVIGKAERWEEEEAEPEPEIDMSALAGKRINKAGNAVDSHGDIYGRVIEGNLQRLIGRMCDKNGFIRNEGGDVIGKCELIPEAEREGMKEGPFAELPGCTVNREGHVVTPGGDVVGRLIEGDAHKLFGRLVDDDGDICDKNGNVLGRAERWEPEEEERDVNPMFGKRVNREGNVVDESGDVIGKLTSGDLSLCAGKKIDEDGDVVDQKGSILGHVTLLEHIPPPPEEEGESEEERQARLQAEQDRQIAGRICMCLEHSLDKIRPICKMITERIDAEERKPEEERDEEELVKQVRPLIEEGGKILTEANGVIRGLDPDGRIAANAEHKTKAREASPEEYRLADLLKELTGTVTETIDNAKRKIADMPHAKKELNPLWGLLAEPLFQIIAAVGLLLSGVLGLVGKLLNGLGLGGLVNNLLGGLGLTKVLGNLGLGGVIAPLTGQDKGKKKKSGGGFLGIF